MSGLENRMLIDSEWNHRGGFYRTCERCGSKKYAGDHIYITSDELLCESCFDKLQEEQKREACEEV